MNFKLNLLIILLIPVLSMAQTRIWQVPVNADDINVRQSSAVVLDSIVLTFPTPGKVFARFDGECISSYGDRIVLAASDARTWQTNDGNTNVTVYDETHNRTCFDHTRIYDVPAATRSYYAVAQNFVQLQGTGIVSIHGHLTVEYIPDNQPNQSIVGTGLIASSFIWEDSVHVFSQLTVQAPVKGRIAVNFEGYVQMSVSDHALFTTNLDAQWPDQPEIFSLHLSPDLQHSTIAHQKIYSVDAGTYTIYALAKKLVGGFNTTNDYLFGTFTAQFIPDQQDAIDIEDEVISESVVDHGLPRRIGQIQITVPKTGKILLQCSGQSTTSFEDLISLYLANDNDPNTPLSLVHLQPILLDFPYTTYSVSGIESVQPGTYTYDVFTDFDNSSTGSGAADFDGLFTALFVADADISATHDLKDEIAFRLYPNPTSGIVNIITDAQNNVGPFNLGIFNDAGQLLRQVNGIETPFSQLDLSGLPDGNYVVRINGDHQEGHQSIIKTGTLK